MKVAAIQMVSTPDLQQNMATAKRLMQQAADDGAGLLLLPEYWPIMGMHETDKIALAETPEQGVIQAFMAEAARSLGVWLIGGTLPMASGDAAKVLNTTLVYNPQGQQAARYDKIHLFGFTKGDESYQESRTITPGKDVVTFDAGFGNVGLSVCYDLRFPELYRAMGACSLIVVPAAFTYTTGQAHWEILLRARAVENQCYVLASAQGGKHPNGRRTWGHSMLIDPWGEIISVLDEGEGVVAGELKLDYVDKVRESLPALKHRVLA
ncbi:carbon-nitrogen hydrolase family protein [Undibacterium sp.]|uniref:carbon-nitrogen hydrolase family protein n=1 Tax=Undibacterium sp. TaxID=1914977 RepID=UPI00374D4F4A